MDNENVTLTEGLFHPVLGEQEPAAVQSVLEAAERLLKAFRQLKTDEDRYGQAEACQKALWRVFKESVGALTERAGGDDYSQSENQVEEAETAYEKYKVAFDEFSCVALALLRSIGVFQAEAETLRNSLASVPSEFAAGAASDLQIIAGAKYMQSEAASYSVKSVKNWKDPRFASVSSAADLALIDRLRLDLFDFLLAYGAAFSLDETLHPLVVDLNRGAGLSWITLPLRPIEEEVQRYLRHLETNLKQRQETERAAKPVLHLRKQVLEQKGLAWANLQNTLERTDAAGQEDASLVQVVKNLTPSDRLLVGHYYEALKCAEHPEILDAYDRVAPSAVEQDQITHLRKQMRAVVYVIAHHAEAKNAYRVHSVDQFTAHCDGLKECESWLACMKWLEDLKEMRTLAELKTLSAQTKDALLKEAVEHYKASLREEMQQLYKSLCAAIPQRGEKPCNELRVVINMAAWLCRDLEAKDAAYPVY